MAMTRRVATILGQVPGHVLCWRIVTDGLKLTPVEPSFLDARDAILRALDDVHGSGGLNDANYRQVRRAALEAFAKFGMGPNAISPGPGILRDGLGIVADFSLPPGL
jgi:extracellular elastinolytic metalloproteinase